MRFRHLKIALSTSGGQYGTRLDFPDGLVVVWADNSMGKSTCVRAMLVALGMEAMLTTSQIDLPLPPAMKTRIEGQSGEYDIFESEVFLEIENKLGERITVQRTVKGNRDKNLITVFHGPLLSSESEALPSTDYFVSRSGAATREHGFHHFLARFLGWDLPKVQNYDGDVLPLYLQCIFPYFVVEQTRGWSTIQPPVPNQLRIRDVHKRAVEFLLHLDAHRNALKRQEVRVKRVQTETRWSTQVRALTDLASSASGTIQGLPRQPISSWPPEVAPVLMMRRDDGWISIKQRIEDESGRHREILRRDVPNVSDVVPAIERELAASETLVQERQAVAHRVSDMLEAEEQELFQIRRRIAAVQEDIQRNKDIKTLKNLGSRENSILESDHCPYCDSVLTGSLVKLSREQEVMSVDENIEFLSEQSRTFKAMESNSARVVDARRQHLASLRDELNNLRSRIRVLRQTLVADGRTPSAANVQERIELENRIRQDEALTVRIDAALNEFSRLASDWKEVLEEERKLQAVDISEDDRNKVASWQTLIRSQLTDYGFKSFSSDQIALSLDTYRPEHDGFDLQTSISASDIIRTIWSYLNGMMELSRSNATQHPGCILFDEPRQQSTRDVSFIALLKRASRSIDFDQQVILFTSEDKNRLNQHLSNMRHTLRNIDGRVLKPV